MHINRVNICFKACQQPFLPLNVPQLHRITTKPTKKTQIRLDILSVWSVCLHEEALNPQLPIARTAKTLIRLGWFSGWSGSSLGAHVILLVFSCFGFIYKCFHPKQTVVGQHYKQMSWETLRTLIWHSGSNIKANKYENEALCLLSTILKWKTINPF